MNSQPRTTFESQRKPTEPKLCESKEAERCSRYRRKLGRILLALLLLVLLGVAPLILALQILFRSATATLPESFSLVTALSLAAFVGSLGTMVIRLVLFGIQRWRVRQDSWIVYRWGIWPTEFRLSELAEFGECRMRGSVKHRIPPYSVLYVKLKSGIGFEFSSRIFENNRELVDLLVRLGVRRVDEQVTGFHFRVWVRHVGVMLVAMLCLTIDRWLS